jgi:hypothetical protein
LFQSEDEDEDRGPVSKCVEIDGKRCKLKYAGTTMLIVSSLGSLIDRDDVLKRNPDKPIPGRRTVKKKR